MDHEHMAISGWFASPLATCGWFMKLESFPLFKRPITIHTLPHRPLEAPLPGLDGSSEGPRQRSSHLALRTIWDYAGACALAVDSWGYWIHGGHGATRQKRFPSQWLIYII